MKLFVTSKMLRKYKVKIQLNHEFNLKNKTGFDSIVISTGVRPRELNIEGSDQVKLFLTLEQFIKQIFSAVK